MTFYVAIFAPVLLFDWTQLARAKPVSFRSDSKPRVQIGLAYTPHIDCERSKQSFHCRHLRIDWILKVFSETMLRFSQWKETVWWAISFRFWTWKWMLRNPNPNQFRSRTLGIERIRSRNRKCFNGKTPKRTVMEFAWVSFILQWRSKKRLWIRSKRSWRVLWSKEKVQRIQSKRWWRKIGLKTIQWIMLSEYSSRHRKKLRNFARFWSKKDFPIVETRKPTTFVFRFCFDL